ncbi:DNA-3-methyladenine glycosylase family protein [Virgibacillus sp. MG-45]|uniref:DNA-3-methyladenine glycosylase family protein n=1 Tax=Virgibacillus sp. MG-45 TaxID=3102791 RepID=UPI002ED88CB0
MHEELTWQIEAPKAFSFEQNLLYLAEGGDECTYDIQGNHVRKAIALGEAYFLIELSEATNGNVIIRVLKGSIFPSEKIKAQLTSFVRDWFDLDTDILPFYEMAKADDYLHSLIDQYYGLRNIGIPNFFEALCWGIIGQQINLRFAYKLKRRFVETYGQAIEWNGAQYWLFPTPEAICNVSVNELMSLQLSQNKSAYLIGVAQAMVRGELSKENIQASPSLQEAEHELTKQKGVGAWTAHYVLMRCFRFPDAFPVADVGLQNAVKQLGEMEKKPSKEELIQLGAPWENWKSYATFYLWRSLYEKM